MCTIFEKPEMEFTAIHGRFHLCVKVKQHGKDIVINANLIELYACTKFKGVSIIHFTGQ